MRKIKIKNFGPIKEGYQDGDGFMEVKKATVFIGNQGSGKSCVAKLISTLSWMEKAMVRGDFKTQDLTVYNRFRKHCSYQNIGNYFIDSTSPIHGTVIEYQGKAYNISYKNGETLVEKNAENGYSFPKIMYVPAERNFVSAVKNVIKLKGLPNTLYTFTEEDNKAKEDLNSPLELPINKAKFEYRKPSGVSWIVGDGYEVRLSEASSGFQSSVPLFLVTRYLALSINKEKDGSVKEISIEEERRIRKEIEKILSNPNLTEDVKKASLEFLSAKFKYSCFINIVEEPEQNLFPTSQQNLLNSLLSFNNMNEGNMLVITTHSPYIINYLTLAIKAFFLLGLIKTTDKIDELNTKLKEIVPLESTVNPEELAIYELDDKGNIIKLGNYKGLPSDENYLNDRLSETNDLFSQLLDIEDLCQ